MSKQVFNLKFITPCFCSGADQGKAEIRVPSIRGELRWWFRVLEKNKELENKLFGGISENYVSKSLISLKILDDRFFSNIKDLPSIRFGQPLSYLFYYAHASGKGIRFQPKGFISPDCSFNLQILIKKNLSNEEQEALDNTVKAFTILGNIGLRSTRGCGSFFDMNNILGFDEFQDWVVSYLYNCTVYWVVDEDKEPVFCDDDWKKSMHILESLLKKMRKKWSAGKYGDRLTPLGLSGNKRENLARQASAVRLRPVKLKEGILPVVIYSEEALDPRCGSIEDDILKIEFNHPFDPKNPNSGDFYSLA